MVAFGKGGALETVRGLNHPNPTGLFFLEQTTAAICQAVDQFEQNQSQMTMDHCVFNARQFSAELFRAKFKKYIQEKIQNFR